MLHKKVITQFDHGDKYLKILLRPQLEEEIINLNLWLPEYEQYCSNVNPQDTFINQILQKGKEKLKTLKVLLERDYYGRIWNDDRERCSQCGWILQEGYGCYMSFLVCKNSICRTKNSQGGGTMNGLSINGITLELTRLPNR